MNTKNSYDKRYSDQQNFYWGLKPHSLVKAMGEQLPPGAQVVDLGCGEGKNSFLLAKQGFDITAVDISEVGLNKLSEYAQKEELSIKTIAQNIVDYLRICSNFDAMLAINVLQFLDKAHVLEVLKLMQEKTRPGGYHAVAGFIAETPRQKQIVIEKERYYFDEGELLELYAGWDIIHYQEKLGPWETHGQPKHRHFVVKLLARETSSVSAK